MAVMIRPIGFITSANTFISIPKVLIIAPTPAASLPTTIRIGPIATAKPTTARMVFCQNGDRSVNQPTTALTPSTSFWKAPASRSPTSSATCFNSSERKTSRNPPASSFRVWKNLSKPAAPIFPRLARMFAVIPAHEFAYSAAAAPAFSSRTVFRSSIEILPSEAIFWISSPVTP